MIELGCLLLLDIVLYTAIHFSNTNMMRIPSQRTKVFGRCQALPAASRKWIPIDLPIAMNFLFLIKYLIVIKVSSDVLIHLLTPWDQLRIAIPTLWKKSFLSQRLRNLCSALHWNNCSPKRQLLRSRGWMIPSCTLHLKMVFIIRWLVHHLCISYFESWIQICMSGTAIRWSSGFWLRVIVSWFVFCFFASF